jgi:hypothetical protein
MNNSSSRFISPGVGAEERDDWDPVFPRQQFLYFLPLPQLHGSFLPSFMLTSSINHHPGNLQLAEILSLIIPAFPVNPIANDRCCVLTTIA